MGALSRSSDPSQPFVGQVLGRASPVLEFRAAAPISVPGGLEAPESEARLRSDSGSEIDADDDEPRDPAPSAVRVSRRAIERAQLPVLSRVVRHTHPDLRELASPTVALRVAKRGARLAIALAVALGALAAIALGARSLASGPSLFPAYLAAAPSAKDLRAELRIDRKLALDVIAPESDPLVTDPPASQPAHAPAVHAPGRTVAPTPAKHAAPHVERVHAPAPPRPHTRHHFRAKSSTR